MHFQCTFCTYNINCVESRAGLSETVFTTARDKQISRTLAYTCGAIYTLGKSCGMYKQSDKFISDNALVLMKFVQHWSTTKRKRKMNTLNTLWAKYLCCKLAQTTCIFLFCLALHNLMWSVIKNTKNPLPGLLHQQMLIRANHTQSSLKWSFQSVFKTHVGLLYNSHIPPLSAGLETESSFPG